MPEKPKLDVSKLIKSPMPGLVKSVSCKIGDSVVEGQELIIIGKYLVTNKASVYYVCNFFICRSHENAELAHFWSNRESQKCIGHRR